jgi:hypothetical protein
MLLREYVASLQNVVATTPFVTATALSYEERPPSAAVIKGSLAFVDGSQLDFKEFVIIQPAFAVIKYGYHYRKGSRLVFRYDNANDPAAKHLPSFPHHRHEPSGVVAAVQPSLTRVLEEIVSQLNLR